MKTLFIAIFSFVSICASAQSTDTAKLSAVVKVCETNPQKITLIVSNPNSEKFSVDVYSKEQGYMYSQVVTKGDYKANLDFSGAGDGDYTIEVSCRKGEKIRKPITMQTTEVVTRSAALK